MNKLIVSYFHQNIHRHISGQSLYFITLLDFLYKFILWLTVKKWKWSNTVYELSYFGEENEADIA